MDNTKTEIPNRTLIIHNDLLTVLHVWFACLGLSTMVIKTLNDNKHRIRPFILLKFHLLGNILLVINVFSATEMSMIHL